MLKQKEICHICILEFDLVRYYKICVRKLTKMIVPFYTGCAIMYPYSVTLSAAVITGVKQLRRSRQHHAA